jgi:hypothetical protein
VFTLFAGIGNSPVLRLGHQLVQVLLQALVVQSLEGLRIAEVLGEWVGDVSVLTENVELELIGPPVGVARAAAANVGFLDGAFGHAAVCCAIETVVGVMLGARWCVVGEEGRAEASQGHPFKLPHPCHRDPRL